MDIIELKKTPEDTQEYLRMFGFIEAAKALPMVIKEFPCMKYVTIDEDCETFVWELKPEIGKLTIMRNRCWFLDSEHPGTVEADHEYLGNYDLSNDGHRCTPTIIELL